MVPLSQARILIIDDQAANVRLLERMLQLEGYTNFQGITDPRRVLPLFTEVRPDLILLDLAMPHLDGFAVMRDLQPEIPPNDYVPILVLTADITPEVRRRALAAGAKDFVTKPFDPTEVLLRIRNLLETRFLHRELQTHNESLEEKVRERTQQLLQTEKLAAMGSLLAGVAHELNNPLAVIMGRAALLASKLAGTALESQAQTVAKAAERTARIVKNFLALARQHPIERQRVALNQVIREAVELLAYQLRVDSVDVVFDLADDLPLLWADPNQLHQVVVNLVSNAHYALRRSPPPRRITITTGVDSTHTRVCLVMADTGPGLPPAVQARIFEPFFTTKPAGQGTGLGLSLCRGIIEGHGGTIRAESPSGAIFRIELPVVAPPEAVAEAPTPASETSMQGLALLIADDEPEVAGMLADILSSDGHQVETATSGAVALERLRERRYDLILSDVKMPELDGPGLYRELERCHPGLVSRIIFITGDTLSPDINEFLEKTGVPCLNKPFALDEIRRVIQRLLP